MARKQYKISCMHIRKDLKYDSDTETDYVKLSYFILRTIQCHYKDLTGL